MQVREAREACQGAQRKADAAKASAHALELEVDASRQSARHDTVSQKSALRRLSMELAESRAANEALEMRLVEADAAAQVSLHHATLISFLFCMAIQASTVGCQSHHTCSSRHELSCNSIN